MAPQAAARLKTSVPPSKRPAPTRCPSRPLDLTKIEFTLSGRVWFRHCALAHQDSTSRRTGIHRAMPSSFPPGSVKHAGWNCTAGELARWRGCVSSSPASPRRATRITVAPRRARRAQQRPAQDGSTKAIASLSARSTRRRWTLSGCSGRLGGRTRWRSRHCRRQGSA